jgi:hypothetical protein
MADDTGGDIVKKLRWMADLMPNTATFAQEAADWIENRPERERARLASVQKESYERGVAEERAKHDTKPTGEIRP